jgi:hypothetical protein
MSASGLQRLPEQRGLPHCQWMRTCFSLWMCGRSSCAAASCKACSPGMSSGEPAASEGRRMGEHIVLEDCGMPVDTGLALCQSACLSCAGPAGSPCSGTGAGNTYNIRWCASLELLHNVVGDQVFSAVHTSDQKCPVPSMFHMALHLGTAAWPRMGGQLRGRPHSHGAVMHGEILTAHDACTDEGHDTMTSTLKSVAVTQTRHWR